MNMRENSIIQTFLEDHRDRDSEMICQCAGCGETWIHESYTEHRGRHVLTDDLLSKLVREINQGLFTQWHGNYYMYKYFEKEYGQISQVLKLRVTSRTLDHEKDKNDYSVKDIPEIERAIQHIKELVAEKSGCKTDNVMTHCMMDYDKNTVDILGWDLTKRPPLTY